MDVEAREAVRVLQRAGLTTPEAFLRYADYDEDPSICIKNNLKELLHLEDQLLAYWSQKMTRIEVPFDEVDHSMGFVGFWYLWKSVIDSDPDFGSIIFMIRVGSLSQPRFQPDLDHISRRVLGAVSRQEQIEYGPIGRPAHHTPPYTTTMLYEGHYATVVELVVLMP